MASTLIGVPQIRASNVLLYADAELGVTIEMQAGNAEVIVSAPFGTHKVDGYAIDLDAILMVVAVGDPKKNGVLGWDAPGRRARIVDPSGIDPQGYRFGRITGPSETRMPLANQQPSEAEYLALACWIEGLSANRAPARRTRSTIRAFRI